MKQVLQDFRHGTLLLQDVAAPAVKPGTLLIRTTHSLISAGTERMLNNFAKANYFDKARQQPEKVKMVLDKVRTDGLLATYEAVSSKLDQPLPLGYCNVGEVVAVGDGVEGFSVGDRVASNCNHAEVVLAPKNLCARIPEGVSDEDAAFTVIASIGLQGIRLIEPTLGETIVVSGLGLIGLLAVQLLRANGCKVIGFDYNAQRVERARAYGAEAFKLGDGIDPVATAMELTGGVGVDGVLITAATTEDSVIQQAAQMSRKRGRIILTGVIGLNLQRADFYEKELSFQVSCSYGPGRYDEIYEKRGQDYPLPFVRWTEKRNFEAILALLAERKLDVAGLVTDRFPFDQAPSAYDKLNDPGGIGILLEYQGGERPELLSRTVSLNTAVSAVKGRAIGVIGAGAFTQSKILPGLRKAGANLKTIVSTAGTNGSVAGRNFKITNSSTDDASVFGDSEIGGTVISTPHSSHAGLVIKALQAGQHVFVEKPLCITEAQLDEIVQARTDIAAAKSAVPQIMVGFNRRYAPLAVRMRKAAASRSGPAFAVFTVNAGFLPATHWAQDPKVGGGRIIGEGCHFIDFLQFMVGSPIVQVQSMKQKPRGQDFEDNVSISLLFADGSLGQVNYFSNGNKGYPKERCDLSFDGKTMVLDNFRALSAYGLSGSKKLLKQDKGHDDQFATFVKFINGGGNLPVDFATLENVTRTTFAAARAMREGGTITL